MEGANAISLQFQEDKKVFEKAEQEIEEREFQERVKRYKEEEKLREEQEKIRAAQEAEELSVINAGMTIKVTDEYIIKDVKFASLNKNNTLDEYYNEVKKGEFNVSNVRVKKELHFSDSLAFYYYCNSLLRSYDFIAGEGGSVTDDERIKTMDDFYNMTREQQNTVIWDVVGVAVYFAGKYQFIANPEGYSYTRYVGIGGRLPGETKKIFLPEMIFNICMN